MQQSRISDSDNSQQSKPKEPWRFHRVQARANLKYLALKALKRHEQSVPQDLPDKSSLRRMSESTISEEKENKLSLPYKKLSSTDPQISTFVKKRVLKYLSKAMMKNNALSFKENAEYCIKELGYTSLNFEGMDKFPVVCEKNAAKQVNLVMTWQFFEEQHIRLFHRMSFQGVNDEELKAETTLWETTITNQEYENDIGFLPLGILNFKGIEDKDLSTYKMTIKLNIEELIVTTTIECTAQMANKMVWNYQTEFQKSLKILLERETYAFKAIRFFNDNEATKKSISFKRDNLRDFDNQVYPSLFGEESKGEMERKLTIADYMDETSKKTY